MKINNNHRPPQDAEAAEAKKAKGKNEHEDELDLEGTEAAAEVHVDFEEYDKASATDLFAAAASNYARKRATYVAPEIAAKVSPSSLPPSGGESQLKQTLEKISRRLSDLPPAKPIKYRG